MRRCLFPTFHFVFGLGIRNQETKKLGDRSNTKLRISIMLEIKAKRQATLNTTVLKVGTRNFLHEKHRFKQALSIALLRLKELEQLFPLQLHPC